jgi:hypothetical protein
MAAAAAVVIQRKEREIVNTFRGVGATSVARARDPEELGVKQHLAFERLVQRAVLRDAGDGKYYLDELSWNALRGLRRRLMLVMLVLVVAVVAVLAATGAFVSRS